MEDKKLDELTELLRKATINAEDMVNAWYGEYTSPELMETIKKARAIIKELDHNKAIQED